MKTDEEGRMILSVGDIKAAHRDFIKGMFSNGLAIWHDNPDEKEVLWIELIR